MENCWEDVPHSSQDYYPHYNLFQSSIFYDTDNFRVSYKYEDCVPSESSENEERSAEPPDKPPEAEAPPAKEKRVVSKDELYQDPDMFRSKHNDGLTNTTDPVEPPSLPPQPWGYDWTKQSWVKELVPMVVIRKERRVPWPGLCEPLDKPKFTNSKGESMMQKMGWQGGALGKSGIGILRSISPDPVYAFRPSAGFGQRTRTAPPGGPPRTTPPPPGGKRATPPPVGKHNKKVAPKRDAFRTNVLLHILDFVQDDTETELLFDTSLRQHERRHIMNIVNSVVNEQAVHALGSVAQYDLAHYIHNNNGYVLAAACHADGQTRQLGVYKEAPEDVYLVTPDDFLPKDEEADASKPSEPNGMEMDDDENPFLKSIKKSIKKEEQTNEPKKEETKKGDETKTEKKEDEPKSITNKFEGCSIAKGSKRESPVPAAEKMLEFFLEFAEADAYKEMRFLGKFTDDQITAINNLLNDVAMCSLDCDSFHGDEELAKLFRDGAVFRLREGINGTTEVHKVSTRQAKN